MALPTARPVSIAVNPETRVSGLLNTVERPLAAYVLAHSAGAGMKHSLMEAIAQGLVERDIACLRFQFPYMERGSRRPDLPPLCHETIRAAVREASQLLPGVPLFAGGRSFGGRMTSQAQASSPLSDVRGLILLGFPLHAAGKPAVSRATHLSNVNVPMLFLQGTRDELADLTLFEPLVTKLGQVATLERIEAADHSYHVLVRSGRTDAEVLREVLDKLAAWVAPIARDD